MYKGFGRSWSEEHQKLIEDDSPGIPRCRPCEHGCKKGPLPCPFVCESGCGCPQGLVRSPTIENKCIKPEECPEIPEGRFCS